MVHSFHILVHMPGHPATLDWFCRHLHWQSCAVHQPRSSVFHLGPNAPEQCVGALPRQSVLHILCGEPLVVGDELQTCEPALLLVSARCFCFLFLFLLFANGLSQERQGSQELIKNTGGCGHCHREFPRARQRPSEIPGIFWKHQKVFYPFSFNQLN